MSRKFLVWFVGLVVAVSIVGCKKDQGSPTGSQETPATAPSAPLSLQATAVSTSQINLSWTDNANNETGYKIERAADGTTSFSEIAQVGANVTSYQNGSLTASTSYSYRVTAYNTAGNSSYSNVATATTQSVVTAPPAPSSLQVTAVSTSQVNLSWADNANNETGYKIERALGGSTSFSEIAQVGPNVNSYQNSSLSASTSYSYRVTAYNTGGNSTYSNVATATTQTAVTVPSAPSSLQSTVASTSQINLSWTDNANNETGYKIERAAGGSTSFSEIAQVAANVTRYQNSSLAASTSYSYRVTAYNTAGNSSYSNVATATTQSVVTILQVKNSSSHPLVSIVIDGQELVKYETQSILPGNSVNYQVSPGTHMVTIWNGWWQSGARTTMYSLSGNFTQPTSGTYLITYSNPSITGLMTNFSSAGYADWCGEYWDANTIIHSACYRFFRDGTYKFYNDGTLKANGSYSLVNYGSNFIVSFSDGHFVGYLTELSGKFTMDNGPSTWKTIEYHVQQ